MTQNERERAQAYAGLMKELGAIINMASTHTLMDIGEKLLGNDGHASCAATLRELAKDDETAVVISVAAQTCIAAQLQQRAQRGTLWQRPKE